MRAERFPTNPLIAPDMLPEQDGANINGPSLIRAPSWLADPLGKYYLYFGHHGGQYIRLAVADDIRGPWRVHEPGTLRRDQTVAPGHIASPDVHVDDANREIRMYFHGMAPPGCDGPYKQVSFLARSDDGLSFTASEEVLAPFYLRVFCHGGRTFGLAKANNAGGVLLGSPDGQRPFEPIRPLIDRMRHAAVRVIGDRAEVYYSRGGDAPERILVSRLSLTGRPEEWTLTDPEELLHPERDWEGASLPVEPSNWGAARQPVRQLRDPAVYEEGGRVYLLYSVAGEQGLAGAELFDE